MFFYYCGWLENEKIGRKGILGGAFKIQLERNRFEMLLLSSAESRGKWRPPPPHTHTPQTIVPSRNLIFFFFLLVLQNGSTSSKEIRSCYCQPPPPKKKKIQERSFYLWLKVGGPPNANNWRKTIHAGRLGAWESSKSFYFFCFLLPRQDLSRERRESKGGENKRQYGWQMIMTKELRRRRSHQRDESRALSHH